MAGFFVIIKAILTRLLFSFHGIVATYELVDTKAEPLYWCFGITVLVLIIEGIITLKKNLDWKWICPSVIIYLLASCPAIWLIELEKLDQRVKKLNSTDAIKERFDGNSFDRQIDPEILTPHIDIPIAEGLFITLIEQCFLLFLVIGRWMLPNEMSKNEHSNMLLSYVGSAADIIELLGSFKDPKVNTNRELCLVVLSIWTWSLLQFTFTIPASSNQYERIPEENLSRCRKLKEICCQLDVWSIMVTILLQDGPFLAFRLVLVFYYKVFDDLTVFMVAKNTMVIVLQLYRTYALLVEKAEELSSNRFDDKEFEEKIVIEGNDDNGRLEEIREIGEVEDVPAQEEKHEDREDTEEKKERTLQEKLEEQKRLELYLFDKVLSESRNDE